MWQQKMAVREQREMYWMLFVSRESEADVIYACGPEAYASCHQSLCSRKRESSAIFPWKSVWPAESALVLPVSVSPKRRMNIPRYTISVSAKMEQVFLSSGGGAVMNTKVTIAGVELKNPVMTASGTFGSGAEFSEFVRSGSSWCSGDQGSCQCAVAGQSDSEDRRDLRSGMLNAIGLQNPGIDVFVKRDIPFLKKYDTKIIVNVCGKSEEDYCEVVERLADEPVDMLEINVSCPNVKEGGIAFGQDPKAAAAYYRAGEKTCKTAGDHEIKSQCNRYYCYGKGSRSWWSRCSLHDQYTDRYEDRYP